MCESGGEVTASWMPGPVDACSSCVFSVNNGSLIEVVLTTGKGGRSILGSKRGLDARIDGRTASSVCEMS